MDWFEKKPGRLAVSMQGDGSVVQLFPMTTVPDIVRLPSDFGGGIVKVLRVDQRECPECENVHDYWHLDKVTGEGHLAVIECPLFGKYLWVSIPDES